MVHYPRRPEICSEGGKGQAGGKNANAFFCIFLHIQEPMVFCIFCIFLHFFCICFAFSFLLMSQSMDKFVLRGVANDAAADVDDLEGPSASIVVEKRLWNCSVCASVVGLHFFCIFLHLFAFFCIAFFAISNLHPPPPPWEGGDAQTAHHATFSTASAHQRLGSANAETTPAGAPAAAADRKQRSDTTCEGTNG